MKDLLDKLIEVSKTDKNVLKELKTLAVKAKQYELAATLRDEEKKLFPQSPEEREAKDLNAVFRMVGLDIEEPVAWLIYRTSIVYYNKSSEFSVGDAEELKALREKNFS